MRKTLIVVAALVVASCASETRLPGPVRAAVSARHIGQTVELRQSMYYGDLYDDNEKWLLSPYPFAETYHIVDPRGAPIHPIGQRGMFPAGSRFVIQRIEFPDVAAMAKRMLTSPRYNPWVYLTPAAGTLAPQGRKFFIVVLPMDLDDEPSVERALAAVLAPDGEVTKWLGTMRPTARVAIQNKDIVTGMTLAEVTAAMGEPQRLLSDTMASGEHVTVVWYPSKEAWIVGGKVAEVRPGRPIEEAPAGTPAPAPATAPAAAPAPAPAPAAAPAPATTEASQSAASPAEATRAEGPEKTAQAPEAARAADAPAAKPDPAGTATSAQPDAASTATSAKLEQTKPAARASKKTARKKRASEPHR